MNRRRKWQEAQKTPETAKEFLTKLIKEEQRKMKTGYTDGNYARKLIEEALEQTEDPETRAVLLECSRLCPPVDPFAELAFDFDAEEKIYPIYWEPGEIVKFGRYPQGANGEAEPIEWLVLDADYAGTGKNTRLLISRYALDAKPFNVKSKKIIWENCTLRAWLNKEFLEQAFTEEEQKELVLTHVEIPDYKKYKTLGRNVTEDRVFLLSLNEVQKKTTWFKNDDERVCYPTQMAKNNGAACTKSKGACCWWLRLPGFDSDYAAYVWSDGFVDSYGCDVHDVDVCVRPVVVLLVASPEELYAKGKALFVAGDYDGASKAFKRLGNYHAAEMQMRVNELMYAKGKALFAAGDYFSAFKAFNEIRGYKDVDSILSNDENKAAAQAAYIAQFEVGKTVTFGSYGGESIEWLVLEANDDERIMISANGLDMVCFNKDRKKENKWESSYVRTWLNGVFYDAAFNASEQAQLIAGVTGDKVYLLSVEEAERYFANDDARVCCSSQSAVNNGTSTSMSGACWWWLRSPGLDSYSAAVVNFDGRVDSSGYYVYNSVGCVRPVVTLRL